MWPTQPNTHPLLPRRLAGAWMALCLATLAWDFGGLDLSAMQHIGTPQGFPLRHRFLLETVLHDGARWISIALYGWLLVWAVRRRPHKGLGAPSRRERLTALALVTLALLLVSLLKRSSQSSCPWEWTAFGGQAAYVSHWDWFTRDGGAGHCFPGGHASSALSFFAVCLPWLWSPAAGRQAAPGWYLLVGVLLAGLVAGVAQTLRGAHPPSHTLWTALICFSVALAGWRLALPWLHAQDSTP
jgi:membrane-associated PAP2 superfamily phosphatase